MREFKLMDGDSHVIEPPDLWQSRVPAKYKDRAPRMERFEKGDAWIIEGAVDPINFGHNVLGGTPRRPDPRGQTRVGLLGGRAQGYLRPCRPPGGHGTRMA